MKLSKSIKMVGILLKVDVLLKVMYFFKDGEVFKNWRISECWLIDWRVLQIGECWCDGTHLFPHITPSSSSFLLKKYCFHHVRPQYKLNK